MKLHSLVVAGFSAIVLVGSLVHPAQPASALDPPPPVEKEHRVPEVTRVTLPLDHAISLLDASWIAKTLPEPVLAYRFENPQIAGEFAPHNEWTVSQFLTQFSIDWGTEPEVVGLIVERPVAQDQDSKIQPEMTVITGAPKLTAALATGAKVDAFEEARAPAGTSASAVGINLLPNEWRPSSIAVNIQKHPGLPGVYVNQFASWQSGASPANVNSNFGWEMEVNLRNSSVPAGYRPACNANFKDQFFAKNYSWYSWSVFNSSYTSIGATSPYADYNDLGDSCSKQSIAVGMKNPQSMLPSPNNPPFALVLDIHAPSGNVATNKIGALWQTVDKTYCNRWPGNTMSSTDCMGVDQLRYPDRDTYVRPVLSEGRDYVAPDRCWQSDDYGTTDPYSIFPGSGC